MKKTSLSLAALLMIVFSLHIPVSAQTSATWQGGKPGRPTDWNCPGNWKEGRPPNEFSQVLIPSCLVYYPVLEKEVEPIDALLIEGGASVTLQKGAVLIILCETGRFNGLILLGKINNEGALEIRNTQELSLVILNNH